MNYLVKFRYNQSHMVRLLSFIWKFVLIVAIFFSSGWLQACTGATLSAPEASLADKPGARVEPDSIAMIAAPATLPNSEPEPTVTPVLTPTNSSPGGQISRAFYDPPPTLPAIILPELMKTGVSPVTYLSNTCQYIENRWGEGKSSPGTVVVPIMFHSVVQPGRLINDTTSISMEYFEYFMDTAKDMGFATITTQELVGFLEHNQEIPERSMILILDDRRPGVTELFMPYLEENDWTLTLGWIAADSTRVAVWETMTALASTGRLDVQSHGFNHIYIQDYINLAQIEEELFKPIEVIEARFGTRPIAHVWPGGNFDTRAIALARDAGYKLGFTVYSRGPIMFNWIPLGEPEIAMDAPLLVLPRFWSTGAVQALEEAVLVSEAAKENAQVSEESELAYFFNYCQPQGSE